MIDSLYEIFKPWSEKGSIYIISDTHFEDANCKLIDANWITPEEQVKKIQQIAHKNDTLIHLGDVGKPEYLKQLKCKKILIMGNHDVSKTKFQPYFDEIYEGPLFISKKILLSHEPIEELDFCLNIHGHDHNGFFRKNHINVAANICNYTPINLKEIIKQGAISKINTIHRETINNASERKKKK